MLEQRLKVKLPTVSCLVARRLRTEITRDDTMASDLFTLSEIESAIPVVRSAVPPTPQYAWPQLAARTGAEVFVKHENHTPTGAFKVRGGLVYMDRLRREQPQVKGIISATRGNHGQSLAFAARR